MARRGTLFDDIEENDSAPLPSKEIPKDEAGKTLSTNCLTKSDAICAKTTSSDTNTITIKKHKPTILGGKDSRKIPNDINYVRKTVTVLIDKDLQKIKVAVIEAQLEDTSERSNNEQYYNMNIEKAKKHFAEDIEAFEAYRIGYQQQIKVWMVKPLERIIDIIKSMPQSLEIAQIGCSIGMLAHKLPNKVYAFDTTSTSDDIIECSLTNTSLNDEAVEVVVLCVSLHSGDLEELLLETNRILCSAGVAFFAEIQTACEDLTLFLNVIKLYGFHMIQKVSVEDTYVFQLEKIRSVEREKTMETE